MSSERRRPSSSQPRPASRRAGDPGSRRPGLAGDNVTSGAGAEGASGDGAAGRADLARILGYDPDVPATWPANARVAPAEQAEGTGTGEEPADDDPVTLTDAKAMRALAHPLRMAILELFAVRATLTATQASEALGESPANCAFHLRTLAKYGFVREAGGGRGRERPWSLASRSMTLVTNQPDPRAALAAGELSRIWLERWIDRARRVYGSRNDLPGWDEGSGWSNTHVFLTPEETVTLRREMRGLLNRYEDRLTGARVRATRASVRVRATRATRATRARAGRTTGTSRIPPALITRYILIQSAKRDTS